MVLVLGMEARMRDGRTMYRHDDGMGVMFPVNYKL